MRRLTSPTWLTLALCLAAINFFNNAAVETSNVYMALYARSVGSSNFQVGLIGAALGVTFVISSLIFGRLSDMYGRVNFIRIGLLLTAVSFFSQALAHSPWTLLAARSFVGFAGGVMTSAIMAYTWENQKQIGNFISYGALGWMVGAMLAALIKVYSSIFIFSAVMAFIAFLLSFLIREQAETAVRMRVSAFPIKLFTSNWKVFTAFFLRQVGAMCIWAVWPLYLNSIGASMLWISVMDATNMVGQFFASRYIERFNPARMFQLGLAGSVIVFLLYGVARHYLWIIPVQLLLAAGYSALFVGALHYLLIRHKERGTVAGLLNSTMSFAGSVGPFLGGVISQAWGYVAVMFAGAGICALASVSAIGLKSQKQAESAVTARGG
ncbi:MAG TPA: MFS transporter [Dehalococcoidales bacterium]|nr:MFS transporter [Dehalococcoidales bacterium]